MDQSSYVDSIKGLEGVVVRALLHTQGYLITGEILSPEICSQLSMDLKNSNNIGATVSTNEAVRDAALLAHSDAALGILDNEDFGSLIDEAAGSDAVLSRAEGLMVFEQRRLTWRRDFDLILRSVPSRTFSPGITVLIPLGDSPGEIEIIRSSQILISKLIPSSREFVQRIVLPKGHGILLQGGIYYSISSQLSAWLCLAFIRPWIKPEILLSSALGQERITQLGPRGRRWCGLYIGLPTSIEEFLEIETAALSGDFGRAKGSGI